MNTWLASFQEESGSALHEYHMLLKGASLRLAEAACDQLGGRKRKSVHGSVNRGTYSLTGTG